MNNYFEDIDPWARPIPFSFEKGSSFDDRVASIERLMHSSISMRTVKAFIKQSFLQDDDCTNSSQTNTVGNNGGVIATGGGMGISMNPSDKQRKRNSTSNDPSSLLTSIENRRASLTAETMENLILQKLVEVGADKHIRNAIFKLHVHGSGGDPNSVTMWNHQQQHQNSGRSPGGKKSRKNGLSAGGMDGSGDDEKMSRSPSFIHHQSLLSQSSLHQLSSSGGGSGSGGTLLSSPSRPVKGHHHHHSHHSHHHGNNYSSSFEAALDELTASFISLRGGWHQPPQEQSQTTTTTTTTMTSTTMGAQRNSISSVMLKGGSTGSLSPQTSFKPSSDKSNNSTTTSSSSKDKDTASFNSLFLNDRLHTAVDKSRNVEHARRQWETSVNEELLSIALEQRKPLIKLKSSSTSSSAAATAIPPPSLLNKEELSSDNGGSGGEGGEKVAGGKGQIRFLYDCDDLLDAIANIQPEKSVNYSLNSSGVRIGGPLDILDGSLWGLMKAGLNTPDVFQLRKKFKKLSPENWQVRCLYVVIFFFQF
jgi:hypothetical protein